MDTDPVAGVGVDTDLVVKPVAAILAIVGTVEEVPIPEVTTSIATKEGIQPEEPGEVAGIAAEERLEVDSQAIEAGILVVGVGSLSCLEEELRTVEVGLELVHTAGVVEVIRSQMVEAFHIVVVGVGRKEPGEACRTVVAGAACRTLGEAFRILEVVAAGRTCPSGSPAWLLEVVGSSQPGAGRSP